MVSAICIGKTPGQDSNAGQPLENISSWTGKLGVILGSGVGLSERALSTRLKVTADDIMRDVSSSCRNLSVLFERVRKSCEALVASPTNRLKQILVARQPRSMKNDNEGVGAPSEPRVLASRSLRPECYRGEPRQFEDLWPRYRCLGFCS